MIEKYRKHIYCQKTFIADCLSQLDNISSCERQSALLFWSEIQNIIFSPNIKLFLDYDKEQFENIIKDINKRRLNAARKGREIELKPIESLLLDIDNKQQTGSLHIHFTQINIKNQRWLTESVEKQNAIFLVDEDIESAEQIQNDYGIVVIGRQNYNKLKDLLRDKSIAIRGQEINNWKKILSGMQVSGNCLIIVDNYVLNDTTLFCENIKSLFEVLLPFQLVDELTFQILIVTTLRQNKVSDLDCCIRYKKTAEIIDDIRPKLNYEISFLKNDGCMFHDRTIITNYAYISCGAGFDLFKNGVSQKTTTIMNYPFYINNQSMWLSDAYSNLLVDLCKIYDSAPEYVQNNMPYFIIGKKENRIIEDYKKLMQ